MFRAIKRSITYLSLRISNKLRDRWSVDTRAVCIYFPYTIYMHVLICSTYPYDQVNVIAYIGASIGLTRHAAALHDRRSRLCSIFIYFTCSSCFFSDRLILYNSSNIYIIPYPEGSTWVIIKNYLIFLLYRNFYNIKYKCVLKLELYFLK